MPDALGSRYTWVLIIVNSVKSRQNLQDYSIKVTSDIDVSNNKKNSWSLEDDCTSTECNKAASLCWDRWSPV